MARVKVKDISFDDVDIWQLVHERATIEMLTKVLEDRGYWVYEKDPNNAAPLDQISFDTVVDWLRDHNFQVTYPGEWAIIESDAKPTDFGRWTQIQTEMDRLDLYSDSAKIGILSYVVGTLLDLIQPPSVRAARTNTEAKEK